MLTQENQLDKLSFTVNIGTLPKVESVPSLETMGENL